MRLPQWSYQHSRLLFAAADAVLLAVALGISAGLRFDGRVPPDLLAQLPRLILLSVLIKITVFYVVQLYDLSWSQVGLEDMITVVRAVTAGSAVFWLAALLLQEIGWFGNLPRAVVLLDYVISLYLIVALRLGRRVMQYLTRHSGRGRVAMIVGAGAAGEQLIRSLRQTPTSGYDPLGFVDDNPRKIGTFIHGLRVLGSRESLPAIIRGRGVEAVLIAMPSASSRVIRNVVSMSRQAGVREIRIVPGLDRILDSQIGFTDLREVQLADLLGREVVRIDAAAVEQWLCDRVVLVTGAGGSIGAELCRQLVRFRPRKVALLDCDETGLFWVEQEMRRLNQAVDTFLLDIRNPAAVRDACLAVRPDVVFHAAAYKHVGLMERHPEQAVSANILGTWVVATAAAEAGVEKFVLISTDKAVNPSSMMGVTKRVAEQICLALNDRGSTHFLAVRFGNVLGSRGSVIPLFQDRIRRGEPLIVRGPNMRRYFMDLSEAVLLILQAGAVGQGGEIFVLDMGEPVPIADLARELIRLSGLEPDKDVPIIFADPEPGEKEHEDLLGAEDGTVATRHERIFVARGTQRLPSDTLLARVDALDRMLQRRDLPQIVETLRALVPTYRPSELLLSSLVLASPLAPVEVPAGVRSVAAPPHA